MPTASPTGSFAAIPVRSFRGWSFMPRQQPRSVLIVAAILGVTRWASPPPGVAWRLAFRRLLLTALALALWITWRP